MRVNAVEDFRRFWCTEGAVKKIVLTGPPHSGKSTLLEALGKQGYPIFKEAALSIIQEGAAAVGADAFRSWRRSQVLRFQEEIAHRQSFMEGLVAAAGTGGPVAIFDRGIWDGVGYCAANDVEPPPMLVKLADAADYDLAIFCELLTPYKDRSKSGRASTQEHAEHLSRCVLAEYQRRPVRVEVLPMMSRDDRVKRAVELIEGLAD